MTEEQQLEQLQTRKRLEFDSRELADWWWKRLYPYNSYPTIKDKYGNIWEAYGLNTHFRIGCYVPGDKFSKHEDGYYQPSVNKRSFATAMVYLNTVDLEDGGATYFMEHGFRIQPMEGLCCVFVVDDLLHSGETLKAGKKYLLRTDIMYYCDNLRQADLHTKIYNLKTEAEAVEDLGQEMVACKIWEDIFKLETDLIKG